MQILNNFGVHAIDRRRKIVFVKLRSHLNYTTDIRMQTIIFQSFMQTHNIFYVKIFRSTDLIIHSNKKGRKRRRRAANIM